MPKKIKLRGKSKRRTDSGPYPLGEFPASVSEDICFAGLPGNADKIRVKRLKVID